MFFHFPVSLHRQFVPVWNDPDTVRPRDFRPRDAVRLRPRTFHLYYRVICFIKKKLRYVTSNYCVRRRKTHPNLAVALRVRLDAILRWGIFVRPADRLKLPRLGALPRLHATSWDCGGLLTNIISIRKKIAGSDCFLRKTSAWNEYASRHLTICRILTELAKPLDRILDYQLAWIVCI